MPNKIVDIVNHTLNHKGFDYSEVTSEIFIGTNMCCQFGFDQELTSKGVKADISLEKMKVDAPYGIDYFLWLPTVDETPPTKNQLDLGVNTLDFFIKRKIKVYIHCQKGHGRAPTLFLAYLIMKKGMNFEDAFVFLHDKRRSIHLSASQVKMLQGLK